MSPTPLLSILVVFRNMEREAPRTLFTLTAQYQRGVDEADYEVVLVDVGSRIPLDANLVSRCGRNFRLVREADAPSPVAAVNRAAAVVRGRAIALCIDGARMLSPGIIRLTLEALTAWARPLVATPSFHLGPKVQNASMLEGYDQAAEDALLQSVAWSEDGYELLRISCLAASSGNGWFRPMSESNFLAMRLDDWHELGGLHEGFRSPGGGLANLDLYREACARCSPLVVLLGEGTFHQFHGGVATNVPLARHPFRRFEAEYEAIRGKAFAAPDKPPIYLGGIPAQALGVLRHSALMASEARR